jgi:hypothetical protein
MQEVKHQKNIRFELREEGKTGNFVNGQLVLQAEAQVVLLPLLLLVEVKKNNYSASCQQCFGNTIMSGTMTATNMVRRCASPSL